MAAFVFPRNLKGISLKRHLINLTAIQYNFSIDTHNEWWEAVFSFFLSRKSYNCIYYNETSIIQNNKYRRLSIVVHSSDVSASLKFMLWNRWSIKYSIARTLLPRITRTAAHSWSFAGVRHKNIVSGKVIREECSTCRGWVRLDGSPVERTPV